MRITAWAEEYFQKLLSVNTVDCSIHKFRLQLDPETLPSRLSQSSFIMYWDKLENFMDISSSRLTSHWWVTISAALRVKTWSQQHENIHSALYQKFKLVSWTWQRVQCINMVTKPEPNRGPLGCGGKGKSHHGQICVKIVDWSCYGPESLSNISSTLTHKTQQATCKTTYYWSDNCCG